MPPTTRNRFKIFLHRGLIPLLAAAALVLVAPEAPAKPPQGGPPPALVQVGKVVKKTVETKVVLTASAEPHRLVTLASRVEGIVLSDLMEEGQAVTQGQVLVKLDTSRQKPRLAEARAVLKENQAVLAQLRRDLKRQVKLHRTKSVALKAYEDAQTAVERQKAVVDQLQQRITQLQLDINYATIRSPLAGVVVSRQADRGEWVAKGGPVATLSVLDPLKVVVKVPERYLPALSQGSKVCATADALPGKEYCGVIAAIIPSGDMRSRTFPVQIRIENPAGELKPGMFMRVNLGVGAPHEALLIPKDALVMSGAAHSVYAVMDGKAVPMPLTLVASHGDLLEVAGGLKAGMTIVTTGNERLFPGQPVSIAGQGPPKAKPGSPQAKK